MKFTYLPVLHALAALGAGLRLHEEVDQLPKPLSHWEKAVALDKSPSFVVWLASAYAMSGNTVQARKLLQELMDLQKQRYFSPAAIAQLHMSLGEKDRAFEWLEKAYQERSNFMANLGVNPIVDPLRSDPRFQDLLRRIGLQK